jgi:Arm DNA-binding domain
MPARPEGVYPDRKGGWYFKATLGRDPLTGKRSQLTRRGYRTAAEVARARKDLMGGDRRMPRPSAVGMTVNELLDLYLDGLDADERLSVKSRFDYRKNSDAYVRALLGGHRVRASPQRRSLSGSAGWPRGVGSRTASRSRPTRSASPGHRWQVRSSWRSRRGCWR